VVWDKETDMDMPKRTWQAALVAVVYLPVCAAGSVYYAVLLFQGADVSVPVPALILCPLMAVSAAAYFFFPRVGHKALLGLTAGTLLALGTSDARATAFHLVVLGLLAAPFVLRGRQRNKVDGGGLSDRTWQPAAEVCRRHS